jgi:hypothetical protein
MKQIPIKDINKNGEIVFWDEDDYIDWVEKALRGDFGQHWRSFAEDMQEQVTKMILNEAKNGMQEIAQQTNDEIHFHKK